MIAETGTGMSSVDDEAMTLNDRKTSLAHYFTHIVSPGDLTLSYP